MDKSIYGKEYFEKVNRVDAREKRLISEANFGSLLKKKKNIKRILDIGCGTGEFLGVCSEKGISCWGVDVSRWAISEAKSIGGVKLAVWNIEKKKWPFGDNFFDTVCAFDVLEHLKNSDFVMAEAYRVLKGGGIFFATTPNGNLQRSIFKNLLPKDPTHINIQREGWWRQSLSGLGFGEIEVLGCLFFCFPPIPKLREYLRKIGIGSWVHPQFSKIKSICGTLYIYATKRA